MRIQQLLVVCLCTLTLWGVSAVDAEASEVLYNGIGFFSGQQSFEDSLSLSGPGTLTVTVTDFAWPTPLSQLDFIVSNTQSLLGPEMSAGTATYKISGAENVFVQMFGTAQGPLNTGVYGLEIQWTAAATPVPLPTSVALLLSGLAVLAWQRRHRLTVGENRPDSRRGADELPTFVSACNETLINGTYTLRLFWRRWTVQKNGMPAMKGLFLPLLLLLWASAGSRAEENPPAVGYKLQPGDMLQVVVWKETDLQSEVLVRPDGGISFALAGDLQAAGRTTEELRVDLQLRVRKLIPDAVVTVQVKIAAGNRVYVIGKVNRPGDFALSRPIDVLQALSLAGGVTPFADIDRIRVFHRDGQQQTSARFRYSDVARGRHLEQNILLQSGDTVVVP